jgi:UDP-glucuronate 4-epimerase
MSSPIRVVVTGARGFIGGHLVDALASRGDRVTGVDDGSNATLHETGVLTIDVDVRDEDAIARVIADAAPSVVFHLAAISGVRPSFERAPEYVSRNVVGTANVLRAAKRAGVRTLVLTSSSSVYGNRQDARAFREDDPLEPPASPYAASKRAAEELAAVVAVPYGLRIATTRLFTVYGPRQRPDLAIARFLRAARRDEELTLFGDGTATRDYTYVDDAVAGLLAAAALADAGKPGMRIHNLASNRPVHLLDLVRTIGAVVGRPLRVRHEPLQAGDVGHTWGDLTRARAELGYEPRVDLETGIRRQWNE